MKFFKINCIHSNKLIWYILGGGGSLQKKPFQTSLIKPQRIWEMKLWHLWRLRDQSCKILPFCQMQLWSPEGNIFYIRIMQLMLATSFSIPFWRYWWYCLNFFWLSKKIFNAIRTTENSYWTILQLFAMNNVGMNEKNLKDLWLSKIKPSIYTPLQKRHGPCFSYLSSKQHLLITLPATILS